MHYELHLLKQRDFSADTKDVEKQFNEEYVRRFGKSRMKGIYRTDDWKRIDFCYEKVSRIGGSILDVGVGPGGLLNLINSRDHFQEAVGIDIRHYSKLVELSDNLDIRIMDVSQMTFEDNEFDVVVCMEVLEHIDEESFSSALKNLRRASKTALFMTIPFCEPEPLPSYHKQNFDCNDIAKYFSNDALFYILQPQRGVPWLAVLEWFDPVAKEEWMKNEITPVSSFARPATASVTPVTIRSNSFIDWLVGKFKSTGN